MNTLLLSAPDGFAIAMLSVLVLSFGVIGLLVFCMRRNVVRRDRQVDELLEEVEEEEKRHPSVRLEPPQHEPWEKDGDWWKR